MAGINWAIWMFERRRGSTGTDMDEMASQRGSIG